MRRLHLDHRPLPSFILHKTRQFGEITRPLPLAAIYRENNNKLQIGGLRPPPQESNKNFRTKPRNLFKLNLRYIQMKMNVNLDASINNLLYLDYMEQLQRHDDDTESTEEEKEVWCSRCRPHDKETES